MNRSLPRSRLVLATCCMALALLCAAVIASQAQMEEVAARIPLGPGRNLDIHLWDWRTVPNPRVDSVRFVEANRGLLLTIYTVDVPARRVQRLLGMRITLWPLKVLCVGMMAIGLGALWRSRGVEHGGENEA